MTEQNSGKPATRVATATSRPKRNAPSNDNTLALEQLASKSKRERTWRAWIVVSLIVLGCDVGYNLGDIFINGIHVAAPDPGTFVFALKTAFALHPGLDVFDQILFSALGGLAAFLISSSSYVTIASLTENVRGLGWNEKIALFLGVFAGLLFTVLLAQLLLQVKYYGWVLTLFTGLVMMYVCTSATIGMKDSFRFTRGHLPDGESLPLVDGVESTSRQIKILDTNVIIDGRIADVCRAGFIEGTIYIPGFVLDELQHIADSSDSLKRARGRRGLDILNAMRSQMFSLVRTLDARAEFAPNEEVDSRLVKLADKLGGAIVTNDFNLNKVAELQGVPVLNINELANALKPVVLPGEEMRVMVIKEGKEMNQGVGYLDDGTMIVIDGARRRIGETLEVTVSSVLQTAAGKMIFATIRQGYDDGPDAENSAGARKVHVLIPAAGRGERFGSAENKLFALLGGKPVIAHTVERFLNSPVSESIDSVTVISSESDLNRIRQICGNSPKLEYCLGGATRQESVRLGLLSLNCADDDIVLVHDGARPLVSATIIDDCISTVSNFGSAITGIAVFDTLKRGEWSPDDDEGVTLLSQTVDREGIFRLQTPQGATYKLLCEAHQSAQESKFDGTDESSLLVRLPNCKLILVHGEPSNIKITAEHDLYFAQHWITTAKMIQSPIRVGTGYDIHRLVPGRPLILGGVKIESDLGLLGHSDADVVLHAICDALLGAAGLDDIGHLFPNDDPAFKDADSIKLLEEIVERIGKSGYSVGNVDCCVIAERPKIAPYIQDMKMTIARTLNSEVGAIGIKATTNEGIGSLGAGEGIACHATATIIKKVDVS